MLLTNQQIYISAQMLNQHFNGQSAIKLPVKVNFFLQKNIKLLSDMAKEIEESRLHIAQSFGKLNEEGTAYTIDEDMQSQAQQELNDLFALTQDVPFHMLKLEDFEGLEFTFAQMNALMCMIEE